MKKDTLIMIRSSFWCFRPLRAFEKRFLWRCALPCHGAINSLRDSSTLTVYSQKRCFPRSTFNTSNSFRSFGSDSGPTIRMTPLCVEKIKKVVQSGDPSAFLRISVDSGGCSGLQYNFDIGTQLNEDDVEFDSDGARLVTDKISLIYLQGATLDYEVSIQRNSFVVSDNPNADMGCGCGVSFQPKL